jgi:hypothetical protein
MSTAGLIGCSPKFRDLQGSFDEETLNLFDDDIFSTSLFEEIAGSSEAICRVTAHGSHVYGRGGPANKLGSCNLHSGGKPTSPK